MFGCVPVCDARSILPVRTCRRLNTICEHLRTLCTQRRRRRRGNWIGYIGYLVTIHKSRVWCSDHARLDGFPHHQLNAGAQMGRKPALPFVSGRHAGRKSRLADSIYQNAGREIWLVRWLLILATILCTPAHPVPSPISIFGYIKIC